MRYPPDSNVCPGTTPSHAAAAPRLRSPRMRPCRTGRDGAGSSAFRKGDSPAAAEARRARSTRRGAAPGQDGARVRVCPSRASGTGHQRGLGPSSRPPGHAQGWGPGCWRVTWRGLRSATLGPAVAGLAAPEGRGDTGDAVATGPPTPPPNLGGRVRRVPALPPHARLLRGRPAPPLPALTPAGARGVRGQRGPPASPGAGKGEPGGSRARSAGAEAAFALPGECLGSAGQGCAEVTVRGRAVPLPSYGWGAREAPCPPCSLPLAAVMFNPSPRGQGCSPHSGDRTEVLRPVLGQPVRETHP